ncbi:MAG: hypothetical protein AB7G93_19005 [Bdellovibrionales bacterium]
MICFFIEIRVHAARPQGHARDPSECWQRSLPCAVEARPTQRRVLKDGENRFVLTTRSVLEQRAAGEVHLVHGRFYADVKDKGVISTPFARFECKSQSPSNSISDSDSKSESESELGCRALFDRRPNQIVIKVIAGEWQVLRLGENRLYTVRAGLQLSLSRVGDNGVAHMEFPQGLPWLATVKELATLYPDSAESFRATLAEFRQVWKVAVDTVSEVHAEEAERRIASHESELERARQQRRARELEDQRLRRLFREKNDL